MAKSELKNLHPAFTRVSDETAKTIGAAAVDLLDLKKCKAPIVDRYLTAYGNKTIEGLGRTMIRIVTDMLPDALEGQACLDQRDQQIGELKKSKAFISELAEDHVRTINKLEQSLVDMINQRDMAEDQKDNLKTLVGQLTTLNARQSETITAQREYITGYKDTLLSIEKEVKKAILV